MHDHLALRKKRWRMSVLLGLSASSLACVALLAAARPNLELPEISSPEVDSAREVGKAFTSVTRHAAPAVVFIEVEKHSRQVDSTTRGPRLPEGFDDDLLKKFFGDRFPNFELPEFNLPRQPWRGQGQGSGFLISEDGYILTNAHVVHGASRVNVILADRREFEATIVGADKSSDVAVVKIDAQRLPALKMGNSDDLDVGEWVLAVGSPFGLSGTVTSGIVSAKGRSSVGITDYENFIQTDAAINPGNSGGPLLNLHGEVVGINTAIFSRTGAYSGIGLAIPINMARSICDQIIEHGAVTRGYLGVMIQPLTPELARSFNLDNTDGVLVGDVSADSPASQAGLKPGDVIVQFEGHPVEDAGALRNRVAATVPETEVEVVVIRDGKSRPLPVVVGTLAAAEEPAATGNSAGVSSLGLTLQPLTAELRERFGYQDPDANGLVILQVEAGSLAAQAGLKAGMLIKEVNRKPVAELEQFRSEVRQVGDHNLLLLLVQQGEHTRYVTMKVGD